MSLKLDKNSELAQAGDEMILHFDDQSKQVDFLFFVCPSIFYFK